MFFHLESKIVLDLEIFGFHKFISHHVGVEDRVIDHRKMFDDIGFQAFHIRTIYHGVAHNIGGIFIVEKVQGMVFRIFFTTIFDLDIVQNHATVPSFIQIVIGIFSIQHPTSPIDIIFRDFHISIQGHHPSSHIQIS